MTRNEPGETGHNNDDILDDIRHDDRRDDDRRDDAAGDDAVGEDGRGSMLEAEDAFAQATRDERARAAEAGDEWARAEQADTAEADDERPNRLRHAAEWLDGKLVPTLGPPDLGPYDEEPEDSVRSHDACPLCGHPMREHTIDRSTANAVLNCPAPPLPERESFEPLNEVGMVKQRPEDKR